jgi:2-iminobutanoate/2-iminopropanoate deaminase
MKNLILLIAIGVLLVASEGNSQERRGRMFEKKIIFTEKAPKPIGPYSQAVQVGGMMFVSGQIAIDTSGKIIPGTIKEEANRVMLNIKAVLNEAGCDMSDIVKTTIFLTDIQNFADVNSVYASFFEKDYPARETVEVSKLPKGARVEISVIASKLNSIKN